MIWKLQSILDELRSTIGLDVMITTEQEPQGERYCRDIYLQFDGDDDGISIIGFDCDVDELSDTDNPAENIPYVEVRNFGSDSDGGLDKKSSKPIRELYYQIRQTKHNLKNPIGTHTLGKSQA